MTEILAILQTFHLRVSRCLSCPFAAVQLADRSRARKRFRIRTAMRDSLVQKAAQFLNNPSIANRTIQEKRDFLAGKGLTPEEISKAVEDAEAEKNGTATSTS